jgi:hypothetical protein
MVEKCFALKASRKDMAFGIASSKARCDDGSKIMIYVSIK